jgi:hypothetical protein
MRQRGRQQAILELALIADEVHGDDLGQSVEDDDKGYEHRGGDDVRALRVDDLRHDAAQREEVDPKLSADALAKVP